MIFKSIFLYCKPLLLLAFLLFGCDSSPKNFTEFLYNLAEIDENKRQPELEKWLNLQEEFPIIDNSDVYFLLREGRDLPVFLVGDMNQWSKSKTQLLRIVGTNYYYIKESYPVNSAFAYNFFAGGKLLLDSLNPKVHFSKKKRYSLLFLPEYEYPTTTLIKRNYIYTKLDSLTLKINNNVQNNFIVFKHHLADSNAPILLFLDGQKYLADLKANITIENLIFSKSIEPCIAVFIISKNQISVFDDLFLNNLLKKFLPQIQGLYNLSDNPVALGGALNEGVTAFYALKNYSDKLNAVFAQSAAFEIDSLLIKKELQNADLSAVNIYFNFGTFERKDSTYNHIRKFLESKKVNYGFDYYNEGKSDFSLKGHLSEALIYLLGKK